MKFNFRLGITAKLALILVLFAAVLLASLGSLAYSTGRRSLQTATELELLSTAIEKEAALNAWVLDGESDMVSLSKSPSLVANAAVLVAAAPGSSAETDAYNRIAAELREYSATNSNFSTLMVMEPQSGRVIAATDASQVGTSRADRPYFVNGKNNAYIQNIFYSPSLQAAAMVVSAPLLSAQGALVGVLAGDLDLDEMNAILSRRNNLHTTEDAFLVNASNLFVSQPRFISEPVILRRGIYSADVNNCLAQHSGVSLAADYRGVPVISAYRWLADRDLCLVVKLDQAEAFAPVGAFGGTVALIVAVALLLASLVAVVMARTIVRPLKVIQEGVVRFGRGDLEVRLPEKSGDELGVLSREFNQMADALAEEQTYLQRRTERFFNLALDLLCTFNPEGFFKDINPAWQNTLGYAHDEVINHPLTEFIHPEDQAITNQHIKSPSKDLAVVQFENRVRHKDGSYRWLAWVAAELPEEHLIYAAARDITLRRQSEEKLKQQAEELVRSNKELEQFAYVASHDLQEPLRMVSSYVQLIARRYQGQLDQEADEFIAYAVEGANRMKTLINDLLSFSRVGTRGKELVSISLETAFEHALANLKMRIEENGVAITHDPLPQVMADDGQMAQLFQNLIGNAIKFHSEAPPRIHVGVRRQGGFWLLSVKDNGIGIDPQFSERIFTIFQRLHSREEYEGTGIGLAICRKIVERHGGRIWIESQPGQGATFFFTLLATGINTENTEGERASLTTDAIEPRNPQDTISKRVDDLI